MSKIMKRAYKCLVDFEKVYDFMLKNYEVDWKNGLPATAFEYSQLLYWTDYKQSHRIAVWEDKGHIVGLCWYRSQLGEAYFNLAPSCETIIPDMLEHAQKRLSKEDGSLSLCLYKSQKKLIEEAQKQGFELVGENPEGIYDFSKDTLNHELPQGYHYKSISDCDRYELMAATWRGFDNLGEPDGSVEREYHLDAAPHRTPDLDVVIVSGTGEYACYAMMWFVPENRLAYLEPFCTEPKHRRKGLAVAALSELVRKTKPLGATHMTGGANEFYFKVGFDPIITLTKWKKPNAT